MAVLLVIPARIGSTRLARKALADVGGVPLVVRVMRGVVGARVDQVVVATDDEAVVQAVEEYGGLAVMTSPEHRNGMERVAEVAARLPYDRVINVQGDEALVQPAMVDALVDALDQWPAVTLTLPGETQDRHNPHVVKVVSDLGRRALYFSRSLIPSDGPFLRHVGLYGYGKDILVQVASQGPTPLEEAEGLEQLRLLERGVSVGLVESPGPSMSIDTADDLMALRRRLEG